MFTKSNPLVSVIIPCYNQGIYIEETLKCVLSSTYSEYEIIVINDGSTDSFTNNVLEQIRHDKISILTTSNHGLAAARNFGIKNSNGKYILPLDADDLISSGYIEDAISILETKPDIKVVSCEVRFFDRKNGIYYIPEFSFSKLLKQNILVASCIFRRSDYDKTTGYNPNMKYGYEDWDFWISLLSDGGSVYKLSDIHFYYRIKSRSMVTELYKSLDRRKAMIAQLYANHNQIYSQYSIDPMEIFDYSLIRRIKESIMHKINSTMLNFKFGFKKLLRSDD